MILVAANMEEGAKKDHLQKMLLSQMKKSYSQWNKEADDEKIFHDMKELSGGKILFTTDSYTIPEVKLNGNRDKLKNIKYQRRK
jgi:hydrogenase maturation factor